MNRWLLRTLINMDRQRLPLDLPDKKMLYFIRMFKIFLNRQINNDVY